MRSEAKSIRGASGTRPATPRLAGVAPGGGVAGGSTTRHAALSFRLLAFINIARPT
jgi:hypothetical protein